MRGSRGAIVLVIAQASKLGTQVVGLVILSRLLAPRQFGIVAMVTAITGLASVLGGFGLSLSALSGRPPTSDERTNLFWINAAAGIISMAIVAGSGPLIADFYGRQALIAVTAALSVTFLLGALAVQYNIELNLAGQWRRLAFVQAAPGLIALPTAAVLAAVTGSYWAVVAQTLVTSLLGLFLAVWLSDWTPGWPRLRVKMRRHLVFGRDTMVVQALNYAAANGDNVLIGRFLGSSVLGQYNRAYNLALLPLSQISIPLEQIILPRLSAALDDGFEEVMLRCQRIMVYVQLIPISLLAGTAGPLVRVFLGPHWSEVPSLIQIQAIGAGASALGYMFWWVLLVRRQTRIIVLTEGTVEIVMLVAMALVVHTGASAVAWCVALGQVLMVFTSAIACRRLASIDIARLARASGSALAITGAAGLSAGLIASAHWSGPFVLLMASGAAWLMTFVVGWILFKRIRDDVRMMAGLLRRSVRHDSLPSSAHNAPVADGAIT